MTTETAAATGDAQTEINNDSESEAEEHTRFNLNLFEETLNVKDYNELVEIFYSGKEGRRVMYGNGGHGEEGNIARGDKIRLVVDSEHRNDDGEVERVTVWSDYEHAESIKNTNWRARREYDPEEYKWTIDADTLGIEAFINDLLYNGEDVQVDMAVVELLAE